MGQQRFRRRSGTPRAPRKPMFWVTNSIPGTIVAPAVTSFADLLAGTIPRDRDSLRRITIRRMIMRVAVRPVTIQTETEYGFFVTEVTKDAVAAAAIPDIGEDEVGMYLAQDGIVYTPVAFEPSVHSYDIRSSRALRGADRTLVFGLTNQDLAGNLTYSVSFRLLVQY